MVAGAGGPGAFAFHVGVLLVPTTLMGLSLPLMARGVVSRQEAAAPLVARLYAVNTLGAALGAAASGWWVIGTYGFTGAVRLAASLNLIAAVLTALVPSVATTADQAAATELRAPPAGGTGPTPGARLWPWFVLYGLTGAVALGLEIVFFRVIDTIMRSNSYTFGHVLSLYLALFSAGAAARSVMLRRARRPERWFLGLQFAVGVTSLAGPILLLAPLDLPDLAGIRRLMEGYLVTDGFALGGFSFSSGPDRARLLFANLAAPLLIMGAPVFLLGASFPPSRPWSPGGSRPWGGAPGRCCAATSRGTSPAPSWSASCSSTGWGRRARCGCWPACWSWPAWPPPA